MSIFKKSVLLLTCFFTLANFQPIRADFSWGGLALNGIGLCFDIGASYFLFEAFVTGYFINKVCDEIKSEKCSANADQYDEYAHEFMKAACEKFFIKKAVVSAVCLGIGVGCHALGSWLMVRKKKKKQCTTLKNEMRRRQLSMP